MPRTKRPAKKPEKLIEGGDAVKKFERAVAKAKAALDNRAQMEISNVEMAYKIHIGSLNKEYLSMTIGQLRSELALKEITTTRQVSQDDGYMTENSSHGSSSRGKTPMAPPPPQSRSASRQSRTTSKRRSRSVDVSTRRCPSTVSRSHSQARGKNIYKTPAYNKTCGQSYPAITPKVAPHAPLTILRQPRNGEMVLSMTGSPVMVQTFNNMNPDEKANCNIRLADGTMLSLQPKRLRESHDMIPFTLMDEQTLAQLKTLESNLQNILKMANTQPKH